jgi:class 3 adenylate cyclase
MAGEARKTVTIVFTDVTGSTSLGEQLDPEALRGVMARYFETAQTVLERHGGTVEKFIGDAVMAVFGIPTMHEDDAVRAVRAAAELRDKLETLNVELEQERGVRIALRTGVNTGEVVVGDPSAQHFYATGDAVNVAARLEQAAGPGEILLGDSTRQLVRDAVELEPVDHLDLKGKTDRVPAWRLARVDPEAAGFARRLESPLVGRREELERLVEVYEQARDGRMPRLCTILAAPESANRDSARNSPPTSVARRPSSSAVASRTARGSPTGRLSRSSNRRRSAFRWGTCSPSARAS